MDLQQVVDKLEIQELFARYARGVDTHQWDVLRAVFTDDAVLDYSSAGGPIGSADEVCAWIQAGISQLPWTQHIVTNIEIELDGDAAHARVMFHNPMRLPFLDSESACGGYYHHDLVRTPAGWKSRHLVEENRWFVNPPPSQQR